MRDYVLSWYIPPVLSLGIAIYMIVLCLRHIRQAVSELSDKTLPEEDQLKILKALTGHDSEFSSFGGIKSRCTGTSVTIDIHVSFPPMQDLKQSPSSRKNCRRSFPRRSKTAAWQL